MNRKPLEDFKKKLEEKGYKNHIKEKPDKKEVNGRDCWYVEIMNDGGLVIQAFVLMRKWLREHRKSYPIWKSYHQKVGIDGTEVNPAVFIVTQTDNDTWDVYSASDTTVKKDSEVIINYELACDRFDLRLSATSKMRKMIKTIRWVCWALAVILILYLISHIVTNTSIGYGLPLTSEMVVLLGLIVCLIIVPIVLPFTKAVSIKGLVDIIVREQ